MVWCSGHESECIKNSMDSCEYNKKPTQPSIDAHTNNIKLQTVQ